MTDGARAPDVVGLAPAHAATLCLARGLTITIDGDDDMWMASYWGAGQPWWVTEQAPTAGQPMSSQALVVRVSLRKPSGGARVREPHRPPPPGRPALGAAALPPLPPPGIR